jgi:ribosome biogenesis protein ENP2
MASGIYPPRLKIFDLSQMSLKCERGFDSNIRKFEILSDDYKKIAALCDDRNIELHAQYGRHFKIRIPKYGRDIKYDKIYCDLFAAGTGNEIYRLNLYKGQFLQSFETIAEGINALGYCQPLEILGMAGEKGICQIFDLRAKQNIFTFDDLVDDLTSITFSEDGMLLGLGNSDGITKVYDIRNPNPLYTIKHSYHLPIKKIVFDENSKNIITVDKKLAKFCNYKTGKSFTNIEPKSDINDFELFKNSGMFCFGCESEKIELYFIPQIGPAPKWASFLDNITEELEEAKTYSLYEDYKFVTLNELDEIGGKNLIGTKMLKPYMHGYFIDWRLYKKLKQLTEPFDYQKYLSDKREQKLEKYFGERIVMNKRLKPKINSKLLTATSEDNTKKAIDINDERFKKLFSDKDYEIDFNSDKFKKKNKNIVINDQEEIEETNRKLKEIEVDDEDDIKNKKKKKKEEDDEERIVNKEIMKLNEKLMKKKKKKLDNFHKNNYNEANNENFGERMKNIDLEESDDEDDFEIENKIRKLENKKEYRKNKLNKEKEHEELLKNKRVLASHNKLAKIKYK